MDLCVINGIEHLLVGDDHGNLGVFIFNTKAVATGGGSSTTRQWHLCDGGIGLMCDIHHTNKCIPIDYNGINLYHLLYYVVYIMNGYHVYVMIHR